MASQLHESVATRLRGVSQRYTGNRRELVETLERAKHPLTINEIISASDELATSSVYRNLAVLEQAGVVHRIVTSDEFARYELAEELTDRHHHHLICLSCGAVQDFTPTPQLEQAASSSLKKAAARAGFSVKGHRLDVVGLCRSCA